MIQLIISSERDRFSEFPTSRRFHTCHPVIFGSVCRIIRVAALRLWYRVRTPKMGAEFVVEMTGTSTCRRTWRWRSKEELQQVRVILSDGSAEVRRSRPACRASGASPEATGVLCSGAHLLRRAHVNEDQTVAACHRIRARRHRKHHWDPVQGSLRGRKTVLLKDFTYGRL